MRVNNWTNYILIIVILSFFTYYFSESILTNEYIRYSLSNKYSQKVIDHYLELKDKWKVVGYLWEPILLLLRTTLIAFLMQMATFFIEPEEDIKYGKFWGVALSAEWVTVLLVMFRFIYFSAIKTNYSLEELQNYVPGTIADVYDTSNLEQWMAYPFNLVSIWEVLYWFALVIGIHEITKFSYVKSLGTVAVSYGVGLLIWVGFVMYLLLTNFS